MKNIMNEQLPISEHNPIRARYYDYDHFTYPWHFHSQFEIIYVKESFGLCYTGDRIERYESGDLVFLGNDLPHYMRSADIYHTGNKELRVKGTIIQFEKDFMNHSICHYPQLLSIKEFLNRSKRGFLFPRLSCPDMLRMLEEFPTCDGFQQVIGLMVLLQKMASYKNKQYLASPLYHETFPTLGDKRIEKILAFINSNYTNPHLSLEDIVSKAAMNTSAFCRYFKQQVGKSFVRYVSDMRVAYACKLLTLKQVNIFQVAMDCGFGSVSHFNRTFKQITSLTPSQYQSQIG